jgi:muconolactone D-isomerase
MEFLVALSLRANEVPPDGREDLYQREREYAIQLFRGGVIHRMWRLPGQTATLSVWEATDGTELHERLLGLPLFPWTDVEVTTLARHYVEEG